MRSTVVCKFDKMCALLAQRYYQPLRWKNTLCIVSNLEYNICMIVLRDDTSSSISFQHFSGRWCNMFSSLLGHLSFLSHSLVFCYQESNTRVGGFNIYSGSIDQCCWILVNIRYDHLFFKLWRRCLDIWSRKSAWLHNSVLWLVERYVVHICFLIVFKDICVSLISWDFLFFQIWWSQWNDLSVMRHEVNILFRFWLHHIHIHLL